MGGKRNRAGPLLKRVEAALLALALALALSGCDYSTLKKALHNGGEAAYETTWQG